MKVFLSFFILFLASQTSLAQSATVHFQVNMKFMIDEGKFDASSETVDVAGNFNGWGNTSTALSDSDQDSIYSAIVSGFTVGQSIAFKFRINDAWNGREEFPGGGPNRNFTVSKTQDSLLVWYNDEQPDDGPPEAQFTAYPTTQSAGRTIFFSNQSSGLVENVLWTFEGGIPETSESENVAVVYETPGVYSAKLKVWNSTHTDSLILEDYITITEREDIGGDVRPDWQNAVFYEVFVRSFYDSDGDGVGDFFGLTQKLDYLQDLGITGLWLMPINPSPSYHGYDVTDYYGVNRDFGTMEDFDLFLEEAHKRGMLVIIDLVLNHSGVTHPWFQASANGDSTFRDFYRWSDTRPSYSGPWGQPVWHQRNGEYYFGIFWSGMPDINYHHQPAKDSMFAVTDYWLQDVGVDGFRLDAAIHIFEDGAEMDNVPETFEFWKDFRAHTKAINPNMFNVGEAWTSTDNVLKYIDDGLDYAFEFDLAYSIIGAINNGNASALTQKITQVFSVYPDNRVGVFLRNHDQPRVMNEVGEDFRKAKAAATIYLTLPGIPYLYYGEEIGMIGTKPDEDIRRPMQWTGGSNAGFTTGNPWRPPHQSYTRINVEQQMSADTSLYHHYKKLIAVRNRGRISEVVPQNANDSEILSYISRTENADYLVVVNTSGSNKSDILVELSGIFSGYDCVDSIFSGEETCDAGLFTKRAGVANIGGLQFGPYQSQVYKLGYTNTSAEEQLLPEKTHLKANYPNPFNPSTTITFQLDKSQPIELSVYSLTGQRVAILKRGQVASGSHSVVWDAGNLASGAYLIRLETESGIFTQKALLLK